MAMDVNFALLTRVWCVAELVEADHLHIHQVSLKSTKCCHVPVKPGIVEKEIYDIWDFFRVLLLVDRFWFRQFRHKNVRHSFVDSWIATHDLEGKVFEFFQFRQFLTKLASSAYLWLILALPKSLDEDLFFFSVLFFLSLQILLSCNKILISWSRGNFYFFAGGCEDSLGRLAGSVPRTLGQLGRAHG